MTGLINIAPFWQTGTRTDADGGDEAGLEATFAELHDEACLADGRVPDGEDLEQHGGLFRAAVVHLVHRDVVLYKIKVNMQIPGNTVLV